MCRKFTQLATWAEVHAFSQPLMVRSGEEVVVSTPMRFAKILRLNAAGKRELVAMRWGFAGQELPNGETKQWVVTPKDGQPIAIAVIFETWRNRVESLDTFVQVTTPANTLISRITDRTPAILPA